MLIRHMVAVTLWIGALVLGASAASGQDFPSKPIRIYTVTAGGVNDLTARVIGSGLTDYAGWTVVVDNRPTSLIASEIVAKSPADGYSLLVRTDGLWIEPLLQKVSVDPIRDFSPVTIATTSANILSVHPSLPVKTVKELIAFAKAKPGQLNYAGGSAGATNHLAGELFKHLAGVNIVFVPYKSGGMAAIAVAGGHIELMFGISSTMSPHIKSGRLRGIAVSTATASALFPGVPTVAASLPGFEASSKVGVFAPAKTPAVIVNRLNRETVQALSQAPIREKLLGLGAEILGGTPEASIALIKSEMERMGKVIKDAGIKAD